MGWTLRTAAAVTTLVGAAAAWACGGDSHEPTTPSPAATTGAAATETPAATEPPARVSLVEVASGLRRPTFVGNAGDGSGRLFIVEKRGTIRVLKDGALDPQPFLDITAIVGSSGNEQGLLGLAFHPQFRANGRLFVGYTARDGANTLAEYGVPPGSSRPDPSTARVLFAIPDDRSNHNGGMVAFGPDGYLYFGTGDGGGAGDTRGNAQSLDTLLGKILRLDVDRGSPYAIPPGNPFTGTAGARPEIWAYGLRNPWRFSFDRSTGDLWIADVGQNALEEVDFQAAGASGGQNYGWNVLEGSACFQPAQGCERDGAVPPVHEYSHAGRSCSVTGGYVYRGSSSPTLAGAYLFVDYCDGILHGLRREGSAWRATRLLDTGLGISSFGEDEFGEVYVTDDTGGVIYRIEAR